MQRVITDGESVIAPEVPELIKKQDHTPVQSRESGAVRGGGRGGRRAWTEIFHLSVTESCRQKMEKRNK